MKSWRLGSGLCLGCLGRLPATTFTLSQRVSTAMTSHVRSSPSTPILPRLSDASIINVNYTRP